VHSRAAAVGEGAPRADAVVPIALVVLLTAAPADAYVDPGTGGMLLQLVTGGVAGLLVLARLSWSRIITAFRKGETAADRHHDRSGAGRQA